MNPFHPFLTIHHILNPIQRKNVVMEMTNLPMSKEVISTGNTIVDATLVIVAVEKTIEILE